MNNEATVKKLEILKNLIIEYDQSWENQEDRAKLRAAINQNKIWVRQEVIEAGCFQTITIAPPPMMGGLIIRDADPFDLLFNAPYGMSLSDNVIDMIDQAIGVLLNASNDKQSPTNTPIIEITTIKDYAFVAMAINPQNPELDDVLDAIKEGAKRCGVLAERVDEPQSNERITDRILESIRKAEFVIVDLTFSRPNVFYEAGYAHGIGKIPIYIAKDGTKLEFDLKDYPIIFFSNLKNLKDSLEKRLRGLAPPNG